MKHLLGIASVIVCLILSTFDTFRSELLLNIAYWGVAISAVYMVLSARMNKTSE